MSLLADKRILITGVLTEASIAFHVARLAQEEGATVVLSSQARTLRLVERIAKRLPDGAPVIELDVTSDDDLAALAERVGEHVDGLDGVLHSIGFAPESALGGRFLTTEWSDVAIALQISAFSLKSLTVACRPLLTPRVLGGGLDLRRHRRVADVRLDGSGQGCLRVDVSLPRTRPRGRGNPGQPGGGRTDPDHGGQEHSGVRAVRRDVDVPSADRLGRQRPRACRPGSRGPALGLVPGNDRRDRPRRRWCPRDRRLTHVHLGSRPPCQVGLPRRCARTTIVHSTSGAIASPR